MSKLLRITAQDKENIREQFEKFLEDIKLNGVKPTFSPTFPGNSRKCTLFFTEVAWLKMQTLVKEFDKEVAWHGTACRIDLDERDAYCINDIMVYPQEVTGATVNTDQEKYQNWLMEMDNDTFNNMRMQGHSHVNMGTTPSQVDITHQEKILSQLDNEMFYIFLIWNKRGEKTIKIYDFLKNVLFETADVTVEVMNGTLGLKTFILDARQNVIEKTYSAGYNYNTSYRAPSATTPATGTPAATPTTTPLASQTGAPSSQTNKPRKGKRKIHKSGTLLKMSNSKKNPPLYDDEDTPYPNSWD